MPTESELEDLLAADISILGLDLMVIGRQVNTAYGKKVDLLAIDSDGALHVIELKRDRTPREVVAQVLDYGLWVKGLTYEQIAGLCALHLGGTRLEEAFAGRFGGSIPDAINQEHKLVIVASELDASTERIVTYLSAGYGVPINVLFFRYFVDEDRRYLARTWLIEPSEAEANVKSVSKAGMEPWNGTDYYVAFGEGDHRNWEDAVRFGFVSAGGGKWYRKTLEALEPGHRVFAHIPGTGYVGVGEVLTSAVPVSSFNVDKEGVQVPILEMELQAPNMGEYVGDADKEERVVQVRWVKSIPRIQAIWEPGMFANQNTACPLRSSFTRDRVLTKMGLDH
ncbi:MAG: endonuclease NucS domain-containing protein [Candidatus Limnocylindrales bacterium]